MAFKEQNAPGEERARRKEKREQVPALQSTVIYEVSIAQIEELSIAIFSFLPSMESMT
jgi:hypothetical protein